MHSRYFLGGGVGCAPFAEGLEAFCLGGPAFFGFRISLLPFDIVASFMRLRRHQRFSSMFDTSLFERARSVSAVGPYAPSLDAAPC